MQIYQEPTNRFVAEFMGNPPLNVIVRGEPGTPAGVLDEWPDARAVGVRPEVLRFGGEPTAGSFRLPVTIDSISPTGGSWIIEASAGQCRLIGTASVAPELRTGERIVCWAPDRDVLQFDALGERVEKGLVAA